MTTIFISIGVGVVVVFGAYFYILSLFAEIGE